MKSNYSEYVAKVLTSNIYQLVKETPLDYATNLSKKLNNSIFLKREDQQDVFSFKIRGAYNKISKIDKENLSKGVVTASAGNHAQGVALSTQKLGCESHIVMPTTTPIIKIDAVKSLGANVYLEGLSYSESYNFAINLAKEKNMTFVHPFDDEDVIAGQGTIALEIIKQIKTPIDAIFVPIGGGGLISGIATFTKNVFPNIKIIGVQSKDSCAMYQSMLQNKIVKLDSVGLFADGTAVKVPGAKTFQICRDLVDEIIIVDTDAICSAIQDIFTDTRSISEPSGALSIAGIKKYIEREQCFNKNFVGIISGANINFHRLRHVSERTEITENKEVIYAITIPETPGSFLKFINVIGNRSITEFNYRYGNENKAHIFVGIQTIDKNDANEILKNIEKAGLHVQDLTNNEIAKIHIRYMVGGRRKNTNNEVVLSFDFPEYPGALCKFLSIMNQGWNITLFHYRNHGSDYGRVLIGLDVPLNEKEKFNNFLSKTNYKFVIQTENIAYKFFLSDNQN